MKEKKTERVFGGVVCTLVLFRSSLSLFPLSLWICGDSRVSRLHDTFLFCCFLLLQITQKRRKTFFSLSTIENERATTENFLSLFFSLLAPLAALALGGGAGVLLGHGVDLVEDGALFFLLK